MGALQARSRHRPRADRRGAGHEPKQWEIVQRLVAEFTAGAGARDGQALDVRGRRREAVDLLVPGRGAAHFDDDAAALRARASTTAELRFADCEFQYSFRSAPIVLDAVDTVFAAAKAYRGLTADPGPTVHQAVRAAAPGAGRNLAAGRAGREARRSKAGTRRSTRRAKRARASSSRAASPRHRHVDRRATVGDGEAAAVTAGRHADPGAPARRAVRGDHPRAEGGRHRRSRAPTAWC